MAQPPKFQIPGLNRGSGIPPGYLVGRLPNSGKGPAQLLRSQQLGQLGVASKASASLGHQAGFMFSITGLVPANDLIGTAVWSKALTFHNGDPNNVGTCLSSPSADYRFPLTDIASSEVGYIDVTSAGVFSVVWITDPLPWAAGKPMLVKTQLLANASFAGATARVVGYF